MFKAYSLQFFDLKTYFETHPVLKDYSNAFEGIALTINVLQWPVQNPKISDLKLFGNQRTPFHQIEFSDGKALIKSAREREADSYGKKECYNLGFGFYDPKLVLTEEQQIQIVKIKFLNGESSYSDAECKILENWIKIEGVEKMQKLLQNYILEGMPDKIIAYNSKSALMKIFSKLLKA